MTGYLVKYVKRGRNGQPMHEGVRTIALREVHPLVWCNYPPVEPFDSYVQTEIVSWQEFDCPDYAWTAITGGGQIPTTSLDDMLEQRYLPDDDASDEVTVARRIAEDELRHTALTVYARASRANQR